MDARGVVFFMGRSKEAFMWNLWTEDAFVGVSAWNASQPEIPLQECFHDQSPKTCSERYTRLLVFCGTRLGGARATHFSSGVKLLLLRMNASCASGYKQPLIETTIAGTIEKYS